MNDKKIIYSEIFEELHKVPFHTDIINFSKLKKYSTLSITTVDNDHLLVRKKSLKRPVLPGGGSETREDCLMMIQKALINAGCVKGLVPELMVELEELRLALVYLNNIRETLEESGLYAPESVYLGHSKESYWFDVVVFKTVNPYYFNQKGDLVPLKSLKNLSKVRTFRPLDNSLKEANPHVILNSMQFVDQLKYLHPNQRVIAAEYALNLHDADPVFANRIHEIEYYTQSSIEYKS